MHPDEEKCPFAACVRTYDRTAEDDAAIPPRPPRLRDDHVWEYGNYDVESDESHFAKHPSSEFRIVSACGSEIRHGGLLPLEEGYRAVRMSRFGAFGSILKVVFPWPIRLTCYLNRLPDDGDELWSIWECALYGRDCRGVLPDGWWRA